MSLIWSSECASWKSLSVSPITTATSFGQSQSSLLNREFGEVARRPELQQQAVTQRPGLIRAHFSSLPTSFLMLLITSAVIAERIICSRQRQRLVEDKGKIRGEIELNASTKLPHLQVVRLIANQVVPSRCTNLQSFLHAVRELSVCFEPLKPTEGNETLTEKYRCHYSQSAFLKPRVRAFSDTARLVESDAPFGKLT
jgi:hypothetical protein